MERASRAELLQTINSQRDQLVHYKTKLRDVVAAYKGVLKEKEALEASIAVLSASSTNDSGKQEASANDVLSAENGEGSDPLGANRKETNDEVNCLKEQMKTLSSSLTTLTQEKSKIEGNFIADKKMLTQENKDLQSKLLEERKRSSTQCEGFELQITDMKSRIRTHQLEREKEQTDHALMLRELQMLLSKERAQKEHMETQVEDLQYAVKESQEKSKEAPQVSEGYERQINQLQNELTTVRDRMKAAEIKANQPSPFVVELQLEMSKLKEEHQRQVFKEQQKAQEAEVRLRSQAKQSEERVSGLESKLSELSQVVGNYERLRFQDQQAISKLRERVTQLDMENSALVHAASLSPEKTVEQESNMKTEEVLEKIMHYRTLLQSIGLKSESSVNLATIFVKDLNKADEDSPISKKYKEELERVKEEFERYKLRAQSVLKNKKDNTVSRETELLKEQNAEMRDKMRMSNFHHQEETAQLQSKIDSLSKALLAQEEKLKSDTALMEQSHQAEIGQLEVEFKKQRDRTVALLAEKDQEIERLNALVNPSVSVSSNSVQYLRDVSQDRQSSEENVPEKSLEQLEEQEAVNKLLGLPAGGPGDAAFIYFSQEKARRDVEIASLRKQKREIEGMLRDSHVSQEELKNEIRALNEKFAEFDRQSGREGANMEYLKNVLLQFFTSSGSHGKKQMMKALMTILQFSPQEKEKVEQIYSKGWWGSAS